MGSRCILGAAGPQRTLRELAGRDPGYWNDIRTGHIDPWATGPRRYWPWTTVGAVEARHALHFARESNRILSRPSPPREPGIYMVGGKEVVVRPRDDSEKVPYIVGHYVTARGNVWRKRGGTWTRGTA